MNERALEIIVDAFYKCAVNHTNLKEAKEIIRNDLVSNGYDIVDTLPTRARKEAYDEVL